MNRVNLVLLWHMHQPQYRDPATGRYVLAWTRLHALKDYWGMVKILEETPGFHCTFNMVPSLVLQLAEYASGKFDEPWFDLAFRPADKLTAEMKAEIVERAFHVNHENLMARWPRFVELYQHVVKEGVEGAVTQFGVRDWRDLQVLSQIAWMDEEWLEKDAVAAKLSKKGVDFTETDKKKLKEKQLELLGMVLPEYRKAAERGQIEISTTPYYHPILPLLCDSDVAREANPHSPVPEPPFRRPEDAWEQLVRAGQYHEKMFGRGATGLWPSEGSVSDQTLEIAAELGFQWFGTDEGVLGKTLGVGFWRDEAGVPAHAERLYAPLRVKRGEWEITGIFRDHYISDLVGFVYSRMDGRAAAEDLHRRLRVIGERVQTGRPLTVSIILDGENAWEYYAGGGREFLKEFYRRVEADPDIQAMTVSEALAAAGEIETVERIAPGSWINANFDVWMGHEEDVRAWELLRDAREYYAEAEQRHQLGSAGAPSEAQLAKALESVMAAEGSDWCWWYGPEHSTANDAEFDALYRTHLTEVYRALGGEAPDVLAQPIKRAPEQALVVAPAAHLKVKVDGRETSYFEWLGAGLYAAERKSSAMHGRAYFLDELHWGFDEKSLFVRVDVHAQAVGELRAYEFRVTVRGEEELQVKVGVEDGQMSGAVVVERDGACLIDGKKCAEAAWGKILEVRVAREAVKAREHGQVEVNVALWHGGLPVDVMPATGWLKVQLGGEGFGWG